MLKKLALLSVVSCLCACHSNPYDGTSGVVLRQTPGDGGQVKPYSIDAPATVPIIEGTVLAVPVRGIVPSGSPNLSFTNLPDWATYDTQAQILSLSPPVGASHNTFDPLSNLMTYIVTVTLISDAENDHVKFGAPIVIIVHSASPSAQITSFKQEAQFPQGVSNTFYFEVASTKYPTGPFQVSGINMPDNLVIKPTSAGSRFEVDYSPARDMVTDNISDRTPAVAGFKTKTLSWTLIVVTPDGTATNLVAHWVILDHAPPTPPTPIGMTMGGRGPH
jgi:hypothetical protein